MSRVLLVLLLLLSGCRDSGAIQATITLDSEVQATCLALDVLVPSGESPPPAFVTRSEGKNEAKIAIFRGTLPENIQLQARALWGAECPKEGEPQPEALSYNGKSQPVSATFKAGEITTVTLALSRPGVDEDADQDGFVAAGQSGSDCDDTRQDSNPKVLQDVCDASADLNCNGQLGCDDTTCSNVTCSRVATAIAFLGGDGERGVGECAEVRVERRDAEGQPTSPNNSTEIQLASASSEGLTFHPDAACQQPARTSFTIDKKQTFVRLYAKGTKLGEQRLSADSSGFSQASVTYQFRPGDATQVVFTSAAGSIQAGACVLVGLERRDVYGNPTTHGPKLVTLTPMSTSQTSFHGDAACSAATRVSTADFAARTSLEVYFRSELVNVFTLKVVGIGSELVRAQTVVPAPPSRMGLTLTPPSAGKTLLAGECSRVAAVKTFDPFNNPSAPASGSVALSAPAPMGVSFYSDSACTTSTTTATLGGTAATANFYFKIRTGGVSVELTASVDALTAKQSQTVTPTVRRGTCTMLNGSSLAECPISPKLNSREGSFLVFQATTTDDMPRSSSIRCQLKDDDKVVCNRHRSASELAQIQWQVVEFASGLKVQQLEGTCGAPSKGVSIPVLQPIVDPTKAFILYSSSRDGNAVSANDFVTVQFSADFTKVDIAMDPLQDCKSEVYSVQIVEFDGAQVKRGSVTGPAPDSPFYAADAFTEADASHSVLLSTFQIPADDTKKNLCNRMLRGHIDASATGPRLVFSRGLDTFCNLPRLSAVSWQRIQFPVETIVQARTLTVGNGVSSATAMLSDVDMSRTLLLSSSQAHNGQATGETSHTSSDTLGLAAGRLLLNSSTELEVRRDVAVDSSRWTVYAVQLQP